MMPSSENKSEIAKTKASCNGSSKKVASKSEASKETNSKRGSPENRKSQSGNRSSNQNAIKNAKSPSSKVCNTVKGPWKNNTHKGKALSANASNNANKISGKNLQTSLTKKTSSKSANAEKTKHDLVAEPKHKKAAVNGTEPKPLNGIKDPHFCTGDKKKLIAAIKPRVLNEGKLSATNKGFPLCKTCTVCYPVKKPSLKDKSKKTGKDNGNESIPKNLNSEVPTERQTEKPDKQRNLKSLVKVKNKLKSIKSELHNSKDVAKNNKQSTSRSSMVHKTAIPKKCAAKKTVQSIKKMFGYWRGSRLKRIASLNALAKVHILYENEVRSTLDSDKDQSPLPKKLEPLNENVKKIMAVKSKCSLKARQKPCQPKVNSNMIAKSDKKSKPRKSKGASAPREIITCRRMASLNAQAILAASYSVERPRRQIKMDVDSLAVKKQNDADLKQEQDDGKSLAQTGRQRVIVTQKQKTTKVVTLKKQAKITKKSVASHLGVKARTSGKPKKGKRDEESLRNANGSDEAVKGKAERERSEKIEDTAEVTITGVYINPTTNASICISRIQTYKQSQTYSPPPSPPPSQAQAGIHLQPATHVVGGVVHSGTHLPTGIYSFPNSVLSSSSSQTYTMNGLNSINNMPVVNVALPRHYSSAFTVPHYSHGPVTYTHGYYQPAGPLIQTITDPCLIHKPIPYHPHLHQASATIFNQGRCQSHPTSPQNLQFSHDQCPSHPTPPYSSQPCTQTKCPTVPPAPTTFPQDGCHQSPQEGFFPDHCPAQGIANSSYHMSPSFQPSTSNFKTHVSSCCSEKNETHIQAPTLHVQPKTEQLQTVEENPLQPPVLTPVKPLKVNFKDKLVDPKMLDNGSQLVTTENHSASKHRDKIREESKNKDDVVVVSESPVPRAVKTVTQDTKTQCRQLRVEVEALVNHKSDRLPCKRKCMKLLRSDVQNLKRWHLNSGKDSPISRADKDHMSCKRVKNSTTHSTCLTKTSIKRSKISMRDVTNECAVNNATEMQGVDQIVSRLGCKPIVGGKSHELKSASACVTSATLYRSIGRTKISKKTPRFSNGWTWDGESFDQQIQLHNDDLPVVRKCYPAMRHVEGDIIKCRDCVLLKSGPRRNDLPFVAKIAGLWENSEDGEMMLSLLWYYRPEHTEQGRKSHHMEDEIFASKHKDVNSVACIEDKCYVLTFNEYCRYRRRVRLLEEGLRTQVPVVPDPEDGYARKDRQPLGCVSPDMVFFCRKVYDFRQKRILKNPS